MGALMSARGFSALGAISGGVGTNNRQWIEVMPTTDGVVENGGKRFAVTAADLDVYAESIRENGGRISVDYDHDGAPEVGGSTRASGWFTGDAEVRDTDRGPILYAEVQWTPAAAQAIRDGEYRFISPEFSFLSASAGVMSRAKELLAATLTNRPFFRGLAALASGAATDDDAWFAGCRTTAPSAGVRARASRSGTVGETGWFAAYPIKPKTKGAA